MNDININGDSNGYWDIQFVNGDLDVLKGEDMVLENACILSLLTRNSELKPNPTYDEYGSRLYDLIKDNDNDLTRSRIKAYIKQCLESMNRVGSVDKVSFDDDFIRIYITKNNGDKATVGLKQ